MFADYFNSYTSIVTGHPESAGFDVLMGNVMNYAATIPEPASLGLLLVGGLVLVRRRVR
jgi:hypothetical protein